MNLSAHSDERLFLVQGEHPLVPGQRMSLHKTREGADAAAALLVGLIAEDCDFAGTVTASNWQSTLDEIKACLEPGAAELCDVWITDLVAEA